MNAMNIDTLAFTRKLEAAGFKREQAEALVEGIQEVDTTNLATKSDIAELKVEISSAIIKMISSQIVIAGFIIAVLKLF